MERPVVIDFETAAIDDRPRYPPAPVGVAIWEPGKKPYYLAWGHPVGNNTTKDKARAVLRGLWNKTLLFHNAKFDLDVANVHLHLPIPAWDKFHDTLFTLFLTDPHAKSLSLKPSAERILGMAPVERDAVREWLIAQKIVRKNDLHWGAYIAKAPGDLVGKYAAGDVTRTLKLHEKLHKGLDEKMKEAYDRERKLLPILLQNEREGMRVDLKGLRRDLKVYEAAQEAADQWLRKRLKAKDLNVDSDNDLAEALFRSKVVKNFVLTKTGQRSVSKKNLTTDMFSDPRVAAALGYRTRLGTCLSTFIRPWLEVAEANNGRIFTSWNQVRQSHSENSMGGTRTGRLSCTPNFQNIPKVWDDKGDGYAHPDHIDVRTLPLMRRYILPDDGHAFGHRDYNQQELRILAHFENDKLCTAYRERPRLDVHDFVGEQIHAIAGVKTERRQTKILNFGLVYGMGLRNLAAALKTDEETARALRNAQRKAIPGLKDLDYDIKRTAIDGKPIRTWGGRLYYCEPPKMIDGRMRSFEYKLLNYLIQGSAADCTKEAIIRYHSARKEGRFLVTVHDEINLSVPTKAMSEELGRLKEAMESIEFDVPMLTDAKAGKCWGDLKSVKDRKVA